MCLLSGNLELFKDVCISHVNVPSTRMYLQEFDGNCFEKGHIPQRKKNIVVSALNDRKQNGNAGNAKKGFKRFEPSTFAQTIK